MSATSREQAAVFRGVGRALEIEDVEVPAPGPGEVKVRIAACGACHSDVHKMEGHGLVPAPCVFGHEVSGVVIEIGAAVQRLQVGDSVVCSFLVPCGDCAACRDGRGDECGPFRSHLQRLGVRFDGTHRMVEADGTPLRTSGVGGLATAIVMPEAAVFALPDTWPGDLSLTDAAVLGCAGLTAYGAVHRAARLRAGEHALVIGAGGVGLAVIAFAAHADAASVTATDIKPEALEVARRFGATATSEALAPDLADVVSTATGGTAPAVVFDTIGNQHTVRQALDLVAVGGRVVVSGLGGSAGASIDDVTAFVRKKVSLIGSYAGLPGDDMPAMLDAVADGALDPSALISVRRPFAETAAAYDDVATGRVTGRALIVMPTIDRPQEDS